MLMQESVGLDYQKPCADPLQEVLRQTMLRQEIAFRKQVYELHRLYGMQKMLMKDLELSSPEGHISPFMVAGNSVGNAVNPRPGSSILFEKKQCLDLLLPADQYIANVSMDLPKTYPNSLKETIKDSPTGKSISGSHTFNLSLSIGGDTGSRGSSCRNSYEKKIKSCYHGIDLEECTGLISDKVEKPSSLFPFFAPASYLQGEVELQSSAPFDPTISKGLHMDQTHEPAVSFSVVDDKGSYQGMVLKSKGSHVHDETMLSKKQQLSSHSLFQIDLNNVEFDNSACSSDNSTVADPSINGSLDVLGGPFAKSHKSGFDLARYSRESATDGDNSKLDIATGNNVICIDLESTSGPMFDFSDDARDHSTNSQDLALEYSGNHSLAEIQTALAKNCSTGRSDESDLDSPCPYGNQLEDQNGHCNQSPASTKSGCVTRSSSIGIIRAEMRCSGVSACNEHKKARLEFCVSETNSDDQGSSDGSQTNHEQSGDNKELTEVNDLIIKAAELLICISLASPESDKDYSSKEWSCELEGEVQPQHSSDSYESITLGLKESRGSDCCVTSQPFEYNAREDFGRKLRRGRRLKDFRRDILPSLASLSGDEICEDIRIFKGVIGSREYNKLRSRKPNAKDCSLPVRSKRSRRTT